MMVIIIITKTYSIWPTNVQNERVLHCQLKGYKRQNGK